MDGWTSTKKQDAERWELIKRNNERRAAIRLAAEVRNNFAGQLLESLTNPCVRCGNGRDLEPLCEVCADDMREANND